MLAGAQSKPHVVLPLADTFLAKVQKLVNITFLILRLAVSFKFHFRS